MWLWVLAGCGPRALPAAELYRPATVVAYTEHQRFGPLPERTVVVTESTAVAPGVELPEGWTGTAYESIRAADGKEDGPRHRIVVGDRGVARFASSRRGGPWHAGTPKVELPAAVKPGDAWEAEHGQDGSKHHRRCVAEPTPFCDAGIATTCTTTWEARTVWLRQHWCAEVGWVGFESVSAADGQPSAAFWSTGATLDGQPLPDAPLEQRPIPAPSELHQ